MKIRLRVDSPLAAEIAAGKAQFAFDAGSTRGWKCDGPAAPGDAWKVHFLDGSFAGYCICCPKCGFLHYWTQAKNCPRGNDGRCIHTRQEPKRSCWDWSGDAAAGTLTASPSLHSRGEDGGCGWHGFLKNGELTGA